MANKAPKLGVGHKKETLAQFAERYKVLSNPSVVQKIMRAFTYSIDKDLKFRLETLVSHPKDTGLLKRSWEIPVNYLKLHNGKSWQVYLINTATVGQQAFLKNAQGKVVHRKKKRVGRHNLKRYMPFVDKRTKFYTKQLRVIRNTLDKKFKTFISETIMQAYYQGVITSEEMANFNQDFDKM